MHNLRTLMSALVLVVVSASALRAEAPKQSPAKLDVQVPVHLDYLVYLPPDYDQKESWPLMIFLHGAGERGSDLELVKKHGPPKLIEAGKSFPFVVISPQCPKDHWWPMMIQELTALLDDAVTRYKIDKDRVYLTGISMGGFGTWAFAASCPERFAAIIPICGGGEPIAARRLAQVPIWVFHGAKDPIVPLKRSEDMVAALKSNPEVKLTVYPDKMHDSWTESYDNPEVYDWLLAHKRAPAKTN